MNDTLIRTLTLRIEQLENQKQETRHSLQYWDKQQKEELEQTITEQEKKITQLNEYLDENYKTAQSQQEKLSTLKDFIDKHCTKYCTKFNKCEKNKLITEKVKEKGEYLGCPLWIAVIPKEDDNIANI